jgi:hypothetical protein
LRSASNAAIAGTVVGRLAFGEILKVINAMLVAEVTFARDSLLERSEFELFSSAPDRQRFRGVGRVGADRTSTAGMIRSVVAVDNQ